MATKAAEVQKNQNPLEQTLPGDDAGDDSAQADVQQLAEAPLCNPSDALEILARTSPSGRSEYSEIFNDEQANRDTEQRAAKGDDQERFVEDNISTSNANTVNHRVGNMTTMRESTDYRHDLNLINSFLLIKLGLIKPTQLRTYVSVFASRHNHFLPIIPEYKIPNTDHRLGKFVVEESFLLMVIVLIVSRYDKDSAHSDCWKFVRCHLSGITYGGLPTVGVVEGLLLLSEHLPRLTNVSDSNFHRVESFMSWNLIGLAVRFSYFLGLDQKTLLHPSQVLDEKTSRERLAWTYCYVFDRQVSIRLGKAFWSRGPGLCFQTQPGINWDINLEAYKNFPTLASRDSSKMKGDENSGDSNINNQGTDISIGDNSSLVMAYVELTQILTNIHDTLYPSRDRTIALVHVGEYYRMLDEFTRTFTWFRIMWKDRHRWETFPLSETVWATFYYTKLYAYSFAFQAHIQRATPKANLQLHAVDTGGTLAKLIFPRGLTGCPDAKFILEAIDSASELLKICTNDLFPQGSLTSLPSRFYGYFSYAAVFLMKVVLTEAVIYSQTEAIMRLVGKAITAIQSASSGLDRQHLCVRTSRQLRTLFQTLMQATGTELTSTPTRLSRAATEQQQEESPQYEDDFSLWFDLLEATPTIDNTAHVTMQGVKTHWAPETYMPELPSLLSTNTESDMWVSSF